MKKINNEKYQESYVEETLDNGLHVILWKKPDYGKSLCMLATPLGAMDLKQVDKNGTEVHFPAGIAHFLEHKMFEMGNEDVMDKFSKMGASVNAFTSYSETAYYFSTSNDIVPPLNLLLDFVQELNISKESVEKEKGIIIQELSMYQQMADSRLLMEVFSSLYHEHPLKYDIGGDEQSVRSITLEQLEECYRLNYHPSTMILVCVSNEEPEKLLKVIRENQAKKVFPVISNVKRLHVEEEKNVARESYAFKMDVSIPKVAYAYKLIGTSDPKKRNQQEWCMKILLDAYFSGLNPKFQQWMDDGIINDYVGSEIDLGEDYGMLMFYGETNNKEAFEKIIDEIVDKLKAGEINEDILVQLKRRYFGQSIRSLNSFEDIAITFVRNYFEKLDFFETMDLLYDIHKEDILEASALLKDVHRCIVEITPEK
ncbi:MAG: pitrilysin family protein [Longicatena sp.]